MEVARGNGNVPLDKPHDDDDDDDYCGLGRLTAEFQTATWTVTISCIQEKEHGVMSCELTRVGVCAD